MTLLAQARATQTPLRTAPGSGHLRVEIVAGDSSATSVQANSPLKILVPRPRGKSVWAYLSNFGGGLLPGDRLDTAVEIGEGARCFIGTQSSTKIFRAGPKGAVESHFKADVGSNAFLAFVPDVSQCFANAAYRQRQRINLADETSSVALLDWYCAGRAARGERWAFAEYSSRTEIRIAGRLAFLDSVHLEHDSQLGVLERMGRANCIATLAIFGQEIAHELAQEISNLPVSKHADCVVVGSALPNGAVIRVCAASAERASREIFPRLSFLASLLGDNPFHRKM